MDVRDALKGQYHAALRMLRECVELCPEDLWDAGTYPRQFWKIAYHAAFYGHLYLMQNEESFKPWEHHREGATELWEEDAVPLEPYTRVQIVDYIDQIRELVNPTIDALDVDTEDPGFHWYKNINKLEHEILSIRHVQGHVGQLSERLMERGIDTSWIARRA